MAMLIKSYVIPEPSAAEAWFDTCNTLIEALLRRQDWGGARDAALVWAQGVSENHRCQTFGVWKLFKRSLVSRYFWRLEHRSFGPGWSPYDAVNYVEALAGRTMRVSVFPPTIACRAVSIRLPQTQKAATQLLARLDHQTPIDVFPESSLPGSICFRRYSRAFGEDTFYEAGEGQAMFVFEMEQGQHAIVSATNGATGFTYSWSVAGVSAVHIEAKMKRLVEDVDVAFRSKTFVCCRALGIDYVAIEGYFNPASAEPVIIVDIDLPFDYLFFPAKGTQAKQEATDESVRGNQMLKNSGRVPSRSH